MHQFTAGQPVVPYQPGDELPGDLVAVEVGALSPDDWGLYSADSKALWLGDTIVREPTNPGAEIGWVIDQLMDEPPQTKQGLIDAFTRILDDYDFEHLLLAHGLPLVGNGRANARGVRTNGRPHRGERVLVAAPAPRGRRQQLSVDQTPLSVNCPTNSRSSAETRERSSAETAICCAEALVCCAESLVWRADVLVC